MENKSIIKCIFLLFWSINLFAQTDGIQIKFLGNCGLLITDGVTNIYSDFPYKSGAFGYMKYDKSELDSIKENSFFLFTHKHPDHYSGVRMRKVLRKKNGIAFGKWNIEALLKLSETIPDFEIQVFETEHKFSIRHYSFLITWHGKRIYLSGDTVYSDTILKTENIDCAFIPVWLLVDVLDKKKSIDSKILAIYHLYPKQKIINERGIDIRLMEIQGEIITIPF